MPEYSICDGCHKAICKCDSEKEYVARSVHPDYVWIPAALGVRYKLAAYAVAHKEHKADTVLVDYQKYLAAKQRTHAERYGRTLDDEAPPTLHPSYTLDWMFDQGRWWCTQKKETP